jgi:predicted permease
MIGEWLTRGRFLVRQTLRKHRRESELDEELQFHVEQSTAAHMAAGRTPDEARRLALIEFGGVERAREQCHEQRPGWWLGTVAQDARYALRGFRRNPVFTITVIATLALGIGATTTIFSAVNSLLLMPLPYRDANSLVWVSNYWPKIHMDRVMSPNFVAARAESKSFVQLAAYTYLDGNLTGVGESARIVRANVTANFLPMLGVAAQIGRTFSGDEDKGGGSNVVVLSDRLWRGQFHADPHITGRAVILDGVEQSVIGVLPPRFRFPDVELEPDVYTPLGLEPERSVTDKRVFLLSVLGRLRPGVSAHQAQSEMLTFFLARTQSYPAGFAHMAQGQEAAVEPLQRHIVGDNRKPLLILLASVGLVLLIACANVANLQLARAAQRQHETSVRGALGASRMRIARQFLVESLILSLFSAALGLLIAFVITSLVQRVQIPETAQAALHSEVARMLRLPFGKLSAAIEIDGWVLAFTAGVAFLTTVMAGLVPVIGWTRADLRGALQSAALRITSGREQRFLRHTLLLVEVGLAVVLLASTGLLMRSFINVLHYDSGFDPHNTLTAVTLLNSSSYSTAQRREAFVDRLLPRLSALPVATAVAAASVLPIQPYDLSSAVTFEGAPTPPMGMRPAVPVVSVTPDYFRAAGTPIFQGRSFNLSDTALSAPVAVVNRAFANRFFAGDALGKRFYSMAWGPDHAAVTIVGVAEDVRHGGLERDVQPEMLVPMAQLPQSSVGIVVRTAGNPASVTNALRKAVWAVDSEQPVFDIETMDQRVSEAIAQRRLILSLIACFAMLAVVLCAVGVYGVFSYSVTQRLREMGIRLALGASRSSLLGLVVMEAARLVIVGGILGVGAALAMSRLLSSLLVGVTPHDAISFSLAWVLMTAVALLASAIPAAHAARTDLVAVLRSE